MHKLQVSEKIITIKRAINISKELKEFIFSNCNYRRRVWNDFVEEYKRVSDKGLKFNPMKFKLKYFNEIEVPNKIYEKYCVGISEQVMKDFKLTLKTIKSNGGTPKFRKFNRNICSFGVHSKGSMRISPNKDFPKFCGRLMIIDDINISFRVRNNEFIYLNLREPLFSDVRDIDGTYFYHDKKDCYHFREIDIKEIRFIHELGKFYVNIVVNAFYINEEKNKRIKKAGIDLGIHNPIELVDNEFGKAISISMSPKELSRINYLEKRISKLQSILDKKVYDSKNYHKILRKICVSFYKIKNIRLNWRRRISGIISKRYKKIIVDLCFVPKDKDHTIKSKEKLKRINKYNRNHAISLFNKELIHMALKNGCKYIQAPPKTTITCSECGYENEPIPLYIRTFECYMCGYKTDRDINAAKNCYAFA